MVCPVVHALCKSREYLSEKIEIYVLGMPAAKQILKQNQIESISFNDYLDKNKDADAIIWGKELAKDHHSSTLGIDIKDSIAYLGLCYKDLVLRFGEEQTRKLFKEKVRHAFYPLTIMERIFDDIKPDFVITTNSPRSEAAAIETANSREINNLIMADLFTGLGDYRLKGKNIAFINQFAKDMFESDGLLDEENSNFYYTGNPTFDKILNLSGEKDSEWISINFPQITGRKVILHADMPAYWHTEKKCSYNKTEKDILEELNACYNASILNDAVYLIRPHPSQNRDLYHDWIKNKKDAYLAADCNLHSLLQNIDLLIARTTTVGLEAIYMQKRVLQLDCDFHADLPLAKMGIAWGVNSYSELPGEMKNALADENKFERIILQIKSILPREPAAEKIANLILEKIK